MPRGINPDLDRFLDNLFPWGGDYENLFKTVSWTFTTPEGNVVVANYAAQGYDSLLRLIETRVRRANANVYVALSTQRVASLDKMSSDGFPKAERRLPNVATLSSIWLDIDVKEKAYATTQDAFGALDDFCNAVGLPEPTMEVLSGSGGIHVYWCTNLPMPIESWHAIAKGLQNAAIAYGLKFDPQVTMNAAGILRVPTSLNWKTVPPRRVQLMQDSSFQRYTYQELVACLRDYIGQVPSIQTGPTIGKSVFTHNFTDGVGETVPVDIEAVAEECPHIDDVLDRGGDGDPEPLWNLNLLLATFTTDPADNAHAMSEGDKRYTKAETDRKLHEKVTARAANPSIGWPKCASFAQFTQKCQTCPHFAEGKSPLNFARRPQPQPTPQPGRDQIMPVGYDRDQRNMVWTTILVGKEKEPRRVSLFLQPILDGAINTENGNLVVKALLEDKPRYGEVSVAGNQHPVAAVQELAKKTGVYSPSSLHPYARDFLVAWLTHLREQKRYIKHTNYGWTRDGKGFTYGDAVYYPPDKPGEPPRKELAFRGATHDSRFERTGELAPWQKAMNLVYGNPPLETLTATAYAAPLVELLGNSSLVVSAYSYESGVGKTTAMQLGQAVWGNPLTGISALSDTTNSVMKKIADLGSLPAYWDELRTAKDMEQITSLVFQITQGKAKSRLNANATQQETPSFLTMFAVASNYGITNSVYETTDGTEAGGLRVFEIECRPVARTSFTDSQSRELMVKLRSNFGVAGDRYAAYLAGNKGEVQKHLMSVQGWFASRHQFEKKERYWMQSMTAILTGATLANHIGLTNYDLDAMLSFLSDALVRQRSLLVDQEHKTMATPESAKELLDQMIADLTGKHVLFTDQIAYGRGRPPDVHITDPYFNAQHMGSVWLQVADNGCIRAHKVPFDQWCMSKRKDPRHVIKLLSTDYFITTNGRKSVGAGVKDLGARTNYGEARYKVYDFIPKTFRSFGSSPDSSSPT